MPADAPGAVAPPADVRAEYEENLGWEDLGRLSAKDVVALHEAACLQAGRELTVDEMRGLLGVR